MPLKGPRNELLQRHAHQQVLERPARRRMPDHDDAPRLVLDRHVHQKGPHPLDRLPVALAARERLVDPTRSLPLDLRDRHTVQRAVVALAQPRVLPDGDAAVAEGEFRRLDRAAEIRGVDRVDPLASPPDTEPPRKPSPFLRELTLEPARRDPSLVVGAE